MLTREGLVSDSSGGCRDQGLVLPGRQVAGLTGQQEQRTWQQVSSQVRADGFTLLSTHLMCCS